MNERLASNAFRASVILLLLATAFLQWLQWRELRALSSANAYTSDVLRVRVINDQNDAIPVAGAVEINTRGKFGEIPIPVQVKNIGFGDAVPVRIDR